MPRIALVSTSDTDLLSARASAADYVWANPARPGHADLGEVLRSAEVVVARILGGPQDVCSGFREIAASGVPLIVLGGEQTPNAGLMELSRAVPAGVVHEAHRYLAHGGPDNLRNLHAFLSDTVLLTGEGFDAPRELPTWGLLERPGRPLVPGGADRVRPRVGVLFYRAQEAAANTAYVHALCDAIDAAGGVGEPIYAASLRDAPTDLLEHLGGLDALVTTVLAAGGTKPATAQAGGEDEAWDVQALAALDIPILQGLCLTWSRAEWAGSSEGMSPLDVATQVAVPEFDGRIITVPFSFKETDADGLPHYVPDPERCARVATIAVKHARLRHTPVEQRRIAIVLSAYPTKHSRIGNAVGLDTPVSTVRLLRALREAGYDLGPRGGIPGLDDVPPVEGEAPDTTAGNALVHALIAAGGQDPEWLTQEQVSDAQVRIPAATYAAWFDRLPEDLQDAMTEHWGPAPGALYVDTTRNPQGDIVCAAMTSGNIAILVQPPRGFGENPIAIYHDPDLPPTHHYLATYRWLEEEFGAHAVVHVGKHGNLEWLSGKNLGMSASCGTDASLGSLPLVYPFLVNDPGEGTQAKRRAHATIVDHLVPPMARAESYGDIARLEQLLDEYGNVTAMDPAKAPALRGEIWTLITAAKMDQDLGLSGRPGDEEFDDFVMHVDGWLCEIKDVQIRDGLHVLGEAPTGEGLVNLVLAVLRAGQVFGGRDSGVPGLRAALGLAEGAPTVETDRVEQLARDLVVRVADSSWDVDAVAGVVEELCGQPNPGAEAALRFACEEVVPRLAETTRELPMVLHALDGGYVPAGPSGSPLRGLVNVLPTGRNFYSVDPKAIPSRLAYQTGSAMAQSLLDRFVEDEGRLPESVGLSMWGTSAMRTSGDDIGEVLALLGVVPVWDAQSRRVVGLEPMSLEELGRPRVDVTVRISGFFRDAFPHVIALLDDAVTLVASLDEPVEHNFVRKHALADVEGHGDERRSRTRIFGSKPGSYGAGVLQVVESGTWRDDTDLAEVYTAWGGYAYGRGMDGVPAREDMERNYGRIQVAAKNVDNRESDILDSDDYFQYHGGMVATVRALTGVEPKAYVGDSTSPDAVRTRTLQEETHRVFRARVVNPRWISAMQRHGYKGAFELAATVDYLFGFDATAGVVQDWMYESIVREYVLDETNQAFLRHANPWALRGIVEKLGEAADRGLWAQPDPELVEAMQRVYLDVEGELEG
ncbi:cobaltochelatase subunit CobN [Pedococcus sp. NPDC057267]|uniref:cobaltochelatase subunit CobN n=1 Tax=Pedococcus sp. NPDC057267 TaxID=3346077 RepID=UPI00362947BE